MRKRLSLLLLVLSFVIAAPTYACFDCIDDPFTGCFTQMDGWRRCDDSQGFCDTHFVCFGTRAQLASQYHVAAVHVIAPSVQTADVPAAKPAPAPKAASIHRTLTVATR